LWTEQGCHRLVRYGLPGIVSPKGIHAGDVGLGHAFWVSPEDVPVHVRYGKVQEHIDGPHLPDRSDDFPVEVQTIRVKQAQTSSKVLISNPGQDHGEHDLVAVPMMNMNVRPLPE